MNSKPAKRVLAGLLVVSMTVAGCASMNEQQQQVATGAGIGAAAGAVLGALVGGRSGAASGAVLGAGAGALGGYVWSTRMEEQKRAMEQSTQGTGVAVTQTADNRLKLEVPSDVSFATGKADIQSRLMPVLDRFAGSLNQHAVTRVTIVGHTDSTGSDAINDPLSVRRAASVRDYLIGRGVASQRIAIEGRGSRDPIADNATDAGRARNRRVEIFVAESSGQ